MSDKGKIGAALVVFVVLMTFPIWNNLVNGEKDAPPTLRYPLEGGELESLVEALRTQEIRRQELLTELSELNVSTKRPKDMHRATLTPLFLLAALWAACQPAADYTHRL
jgi:hypothetical protein